MEEQEKKNTKKKTIEAIVLYAALAAVEVLAMTMIVVASNFKPTRGFEIPQ